MKNGKWRYVSPHSSSTSLEVEDSSHHRSPAAVPGQSGRRPQRFSKGFVERINLCLCRQWMEPQFLFRPVSSVVTIVTELSRLKFSVAYQRNSSFFKILSCFTEEGLQDLRRFLELYSGAVV